MLDGSSRLLHSPRVKNGKISPSKYRLSLYKFKNSFHISLNFHKRLDCLLHIIKNYMKSCGTHIRSEFLRIWKRRVLKLNFFLSFLPRRPVIFFLKTEEHRQRRTEEKFMKYIGLQWIFFLRGTLDMFTERIFKYDMCVSMCIMGIRE